jgi:hypothetical protein
VMAVVMVAASLLCLGTQVALGRRRESLPAAA